MKVRAKRLGYYDNKRRQEGQSFHIRSKKDFSKAWMAEVKKGKPQPEHVEEVVEDVVDETVSNQDVI